MKKISLRMFFIFLMALCGLGNIHASNPRDKNPETSKITIPPPEAQKLMSRVEEIRDMDFSLLERAEKRELKNELRTIKKELKAYDVVVIPVSTLIIVLFLILLLG